MNVGKVVLAAALAAGSTTAVQAAPVIGQISVAGYVEGVGGTSMDTATGLDFVAGANGTASPGVAGGLTSYGGGSGSFAGLACASVTGGCGTIQDILNFATFAPIANFLTLATGTSTAIAFDLASLTSITRTPGAAGGSLALEGQGVIHFTGLDNTPGIFSLTTQGNQITSFSASTLATAAVPEPAGWTLLISGFGLIGGALRRRRATTVRYA